MKRINFIVFFSFFSFLLQAQQTITMLERKSEILPDWVEPAVMGDFDALYKIERFKSKYIFFTESSDVNFYMAHERANRSIVSQIGGRIRAIGIRDGEGNYFFFTDEISASEVLFDSRSNKIEEDYWIKRKNQDGNIEYIFYKITALEKTVVDQKIKQFQ
jgi:hypothetical protein